jgi:predicted ATPase
MIKKVRITNFKSLEDVAVDLDPVTVLIGKSGSGKTNFVEALRWLRDYLTAQPGDASRQRPDEWNRVMSATARKPMTMGFTVVFAAPGFAEDFQYELRLQQPHADAHPAFTEEKLCLGDRVAFHQKEGKWLQPPPLDRPPQPGQPLLGAMTGVQEVTVAHLILTRGIGCYAFPDQVLTTAGAVAGTDAGFADHGENYLQTFTGISVNLATLEHLREMAASLRRLKPSLKSLDLEQPYRQRIVVHQEKKGKVLMFQLSQESEGFRRLLACLLALYQSPPKLTLIFDEPEKGIYPAGLAILADEFKGYAEKGRGQVLLTTHSPDFLDHFAAEHLRVVEMRDGATHIGPVAPEQLEALREHFIKPGDLLTVDEARLPGSLVEAG